jgi:tetratricopeptide (TPR) repeat protein
MRRALATATLLLILCGAALGQGRDPGYDAALEAYKAKRWAQFDALSQKFLAEQPDYKYAPSLRFMVADSLRQRKRLAEAIEGFRDYLERHPTESLADRCRGSLISTLNEDRRHEEALGLASDYLDRYPTGKAAARVAYEYAYALESLRRFDEAAAAYRVILGKYREIAAYRRGVALFRGRRFKEAAAALTAFLEVHPGSSYENAVREYLFRTETGFKRIKDGVVLDYDGKYVDDPRLAELLEKLPAMRKESLQRIEKFLGRAVPQTFLIRFEDAGSRRGSFFAETRLEVVNGEPVEMLILYLEYLMTGAHDLQRTLTHELYHCVQRESLGEEHFLVPKWAREGTAVYVAGQAEERCRTLAAQLGRYPGTVDPMDKLVNGLAGRHTFDDYGEDVSAFTAVVKRHGQRKLVKLLTLLLDSPDVAAAVKSALGEDMATFERLAGEAARAHLEPLVSTGRAEILEVRKLVGAREYAEALAALPEDPGVYAPVASYYRALCLFETGRQAEALTEIRTVYLTKYRTFSPLLEESIYLELRALKALGKPEFKARVTQAKLDLEPTSVFEAVVTLASS